MQFKTIFALYMMAAAASAAPADDLEARQASATCNVNNAIYCCDNFIPFNIFFIRGVGQGRCARRKSAREQAQQQLGETFLTKCRHYSPRQQMWYWSKPINPYLLP